jgi:hypothetical protein
MRIYSKNISGFTGVLLIAGLIIIGFIAFTVIIIGAAIIAGLFITFFLIRKLLIVFGMKKKPKEPVVTYSWENTKELPEETEVKEEKE